MNFYHANVARRSHAKIAAAQHFLAIVASRLTQSMFMRLEKANVCVRFIVAGTCLSLLASCATAPKTARPEYPSTASIMREARSTNVPVETRAADYLQVAAMTAP